MSDTARAIRAASSSTGSSSASPATPATACSSPATASPASAPLFGNDLVTLPEFPAEIRAPAGHPRRRLGVPDPHLRPRHHHAGRRAERARGHEPGRPRAELHRLEPGGTLIVNTDTFEERNLTKAGYDAEPARPTAASTGYTVYEVPMTSLTKDAVAPLGVKPRDAERSKNFFALGLVSLDVHPAGRADPRLDRASASAKPAGRATPTSPPSRPATPSARRPSCSTTPTTVRPAHQRARHLHQHHRQHRAGVGARRRRPAGRSCRCSSAATRSRRRPTSSTSCPSTRTSASAPCRPRTRSPASAPPSAPRSAATSASPPPAGPASPSRARRMGLAVSLELPLLIIDIQRGGPSTGLPTKTEAADLLHGDVRPPRRVAAADRRRPQPVRTASRPPSRRPASRSSTARR